MIPTRGFANIDSVVSPLVHLYFLGIKINSHSEYEHEDNDEEEEEQEDVVLDSVESNDNQSDKEMPL